VLVTHNRPKFLRLALRSLTLQSVPPDEVIIVDDASRTPVIDDIKDVINECRLQGIRVKVFRTRNEIGLGAARSLGAKSASGKYILFIDDDVIASKQLIEAYINTFERNKCDIVAGPCYPRYLGVATHELPKWWDERVLGSLVAVRNDLIYLSRKTRNPADYVFGCNFAIDKHVLRVLKGFKPWLGRIKDMLLSGEEWDFVTRAVGKGFQVCFSRNAIVYHLIPLSKITIGRIKRMSAGMSRTRCVLAYERVFHVSLSKYLIRCSIAALKDVVETILYMLVSDKPRTMKKVYDLVLHLGIVLLCRDTIYRLRGI